jgi:hypothetical protein
MIDNKTPPLAQLTKKYAQQWNIVQLRRKNDARSEEEYADRYFTQEYNCACNCDTL